MDENDETRGYPTDEEIQEMYEWYKGRGEAD